MKIYQVMSSSNFEECYPVATFSNKIEADKFVEFKNRYKKQSEKYDNFSVLEIDILDNSDELIRELQLCVHIEASFEFLKENEDEFEVNKCVREDWQKTFFDDYDDFIGMDLYINISKEEYDNFDESKYFYLQKEIKDKIIKMFDEGIEIENICNILNEYYENINLL